MLLRHESPSDAGVAAPHPTRLERLVELEAVDAQRDVFCHEYERCLDAAIEQDWTSWTCEGCLRFGRDRGAGEVSRSHAPRPDAVEGERSAA